MSLTHPTACIHWRSLRVWSITDGIDAVRRAISSSQAETAARKGVRGGRAPIDDRRQTADLVEELEGLSLGYLQQCERLIQGGEALLEWSAPEIRGRRDDI